MLSIDDFMQDIQTEKRGIIVSDFDNTICSMDTDQYMHPQLAMHLNALLSDPNKHVVIVSQKMNENHVRDAIIETQGSLPPAFERMTVIKEGEFINWWLQRMNEPSYDILNHLSHANEKNVDDLSLNSTDAFREFKDQSSPAALEYFAAHGIDTFQKARDAFAQKKDLWEKIQRIGRVSIINFINEMAKKGGGSVEAYIDDNYQDIFRSLMLEPFPTYAAIYAGKTDNTKTPDYFDVIRFLGKDTEEAALLKAQLASLTYHTTKMVFKLNREGEGLKSEYERVSKYQRDMNFLTTYVSILEQRLHFEDEKFHHEAETVKNAARFKGRETSEAVIGSVEEDIHRFFSDANAYLDCLLYVFKDSNNAPVNNNNNNANNNVVEAQHLREGLLGGIEIHEEPRLELEPESEFEYLRVNIVPEQKNPFVEEPQRREAHQQRIDLYTTHHFNALSEPQKEKLLKPLEALLKEKEALERLCHQLQERGGTRKITFHKKERKGIEGKLAEFQEKLNACNVRIKKLQDLMPEVFERLDKKQSPKSP